MIEGEDLLESILPVRVDKSNFFSLRGCKTYIYNETWAGRWELRLQTCCWPRGQSCSHWLRSAPATEGCDLDGADQSPDPPASSLA